MGEHAWDRVIPFLAFAPAVRRLIYTTNAIESLHTQLRTIIKTRGHFPSEDAASKLIFLALRNSIADRTRSVREWREAMTSSRLPTGIASRSTPHDNRGRLAHRVGRSSQATCAAVDKAQRASHTEFLTAPFLLQRLAPCGSCGSSTLARAVD